MSATIQLRELPGDYAVCKFEQAAAIPDWADGYGFVSISRTPEELSIVCRTERVPEAVNASRAWRCFEFIGPFAFDETGIALAAIRPLSERKIGVFLVATYDTDFLLVQSKDLAAAKTALLHAGHTISE